MWHYAERAGNGPLIFYQAANLKGHFGFEPCRFYP